MAPRPAGLAGTPAGSYKCSKGWVQSLPPEDTWASFLKTSWGQCHVTPGLGGQGVLEPVPQGRLRVPVPQGPAQGRRHGTRALFGVPSLDLCTLICARGRGPIPTGPVGLKLFLEEEGRPGLGSLTAQ